MKLSEAIRKGGAQYAQCYGDIFRSKSAEYTEDAVCALGAAYVGLTGSPAKHGLTMLLVNQLQIYGLPVKNAPDADDVPLSLVPDMRTFIPETIADLVICLNDSLHWDFERIADWLDQHGY